MGSHVFSKPECATVQGTCVACGKNKQCLRGNGKYRALCASCHRKRHSLKMRGPDRKWKHRKHLKDSCESCGFVPVHECQMDVDHIDGDHHNDDPDNLQTLCANCHRLKTQINGDFLPKTKD